MRIVIVPKNQFDIICPDKYLLIMYMYVYIIYIKYECIYKWYLLKLFYYRDPVVLKFFLYSTRIANR